ncbi:MAG: Asp-tRNA(Asn)/Glu-tRNA(Gln) amidotransferase subunit GatB [Ardenticatenales bacterium]|nr:Asp-tRNA(Asn)/Glu-tRNA(Gln) amidotransferase subunit GatB [Ardenticatenales bacterium]
MEGFEVVVGIETHVQILTKSKMFCGCGADFAGAEPNTLVCPVCLGLPGALPTPNAAAIAAAVTTGLALGGEIRPRTWFERKNYHYPDLAKGYQISQYEAPLCTGGGLEVVGADGVRRTVGLERLHLEEDTAKLIHAPSETLLDFNRSGVPLMEIVSQPDMRSGDEARAYLEALRQLLRWLGVSTGNMEDGALRADVNISVRRVGESRLGTKIEIKNLNSFAAAKGAIEHEAERLAGMAERGEAIIQSTRGWDERTRTTFAQRTKEAADDYRYFPEPDLPPLVLDAGWIEARRAALPALPAARRADLVDRWHVTDDEARVLTRDRATADYAVAALDAAGPGESRAVAGWITGPLFALANAEPALGDGWTAKVAPDALSELAALVAGGTLTRSVARDVLAEMWSTGRRAADIAADGARTQISGSDALGAIVEDVLAAHPKPVADWLGGKESASAFLLGQVMRATGGQANAAVAKDVLDKALARRRA